MILGWRRRRTALERQLRLLTAQYLILGERLKRTDEQLAAATSRLEPLEAARNDLLGQPDLAELRAWARRYGPLLDALRLGPGGEVAARDSLTLDVVVCVHDAPQETAACLEALLRCGRYREIIVVDDASGPETAALLRRFAARAPIRLIVNEGNLGYTRSANIGLDASTADVAVVLNSDTVVTFGWAERMLDGFRSSPAIGLAGPFSNAASYQSLPRVKDADGRFAVNALPEGTRPDDLALRLQAGHVPAYPRVAFLNGFCLAIRRTVREAIGGFDEAAFPMGYGEENDYCLRAARAGFDLAVVDDCYVFHAKSQSFGTDRRTELAREGRARLDERYGAAELKQRIRRHEANPALVEARAAASAAVGREGAEPFDLARLFDGHQVLFVLPSRPGGGGVHSIVQEVLAMRGMGVDAVVAIRAGHADDYVRHYGHLPGSEGAFRGYASTAELELLMAAALVVVATIYTSVKLVAPFARAHPDRLYAYYVQDYEPLFHEPGAPDWAEAVASYTAIPDACLFAKTRWLQEVVQQRHGVPVAKVEPSLDHAVYAPLPSGTDRSGPRIVAAMIRPHTPRRAPLRTLRVLRRLKEALGDRVDVRIFGCEPEALAAAGIDVDFELINHGVLTREQVADLLRRAYGFLDLSDYQAFGRTSLEAMACGCVPVLPRLGGASEYAVDGVNAIVVDAMDEPQAAGRVLDLVTLPDGEAARLRAAALATAREYGVERAARSELTVLGLELLRRRRVLGPVVLTGGAGGSALLRAAE